MRFGLTLVVAVIGIFIVPIVYAPMVVTAPPPSPMGETTGEVSEEQPLEEVYEDPSFYEGDPSLIESSQESEPIEITQESTTIIDNSEESSNFQIARLEQSIAAQQKTIEQLNKRVSSQETQIVALKEKSSKGILKLLAIVGGVFMLICIVFLIRKMGGDDSKPLPKLSLSQPIIQPRAGEMKNYVRTNLKKGYSEEYLRDTLLGIRR